MTSLPHPVPSRTAHAIAALYGHDDDTLVAWQRACAQAAETLRPQPDEDRLRKALTLAQDGHVTLEDDGFATVESRGKHYQVQADGSCDCPDAEHRGATCKHALAVQIHYLASAGLRPGGDHRQAPTATPSASSPRASQPPAPTSARWNVHEAPASACVKFRVGHLELLYTLRGVDDAELLQRMTATLPTLHDLMEACEARAATPAPSQPTPPEPASAAPLQPDMPALLQAALAEVLAKAQARTSANGHATAPAPSAPTPDDQQTGFCSIHQVEMTLRGESPDTWHSHWLEDEQRYCKGARPKRRNGKSRR
jgi:hypothetical protein